MDEDQERLARMVVAIGNLNKANGRIGVAFVNGKNGTQSEYGVYGQNDGSVLIEYEGHRTADGHQYGISGRARPVRYWALKAGFHEIRIFGEEGR